jgi:hypothetical protein
MSAPILLVSGGAESVSVSIADWARSSGREIVVYSLVRSSLLEGVSGSGLVRYAPVGARAVVLDDLAACIADIRAQSTAPVIAFPTEDDSLGLILELCQRMGEAELACSRCRALFGGGLDKASLFDFLQAAGLGELIADTLTVRSEADVAGARAAFGEQVILKPASKPWAGTLESGAKIHSDAELLTERSARERARDFGAGKPWVAQRRLELLRGGERSACVVRDVHGAVLYVEVVEWLKYPARGGSACIVETQPDEERLRDATLAILGVLDTVGIVELSFLADEEGRPRLLELNVRPWLQIDLLQSSGFDMLAAAEIALSGGSIGSRDVTIRRRTWISLERLLLKFAIGDGSRWITLRDALAALARRPVMSIWSTSLAGVRWRWIRRLFVRFVR